MFVFYNDRPQGTKKTKLLSKSLYNINCSITTPLTKIIDCKSLKHAGCVANKEKAVVVSDGDDQGSAQAYHEVRHRKAEENGRRLE